MTHVLKSVTNAPIPRGGDDALACLKRNIERVPYAIGNQACDRLIAQTPEDADGPTKTARRFSPHDFACW